MRNFKILQIFLDGDFFTAKFFKKIRRVSQRFLSTYKVSKTLQVLFKSSAVKFALILLLLSSPYQISKGCGPYDLVFNGYTFINPKIVNTDATYARYFLKFNDLYTSYDSLSLIQEDENLDEWNQRFCDLFSPNELKQVIYKASVNQMKRLKNAANSKKYKLPEALKKNDFAKHLKDAKCMEVIDYLIFAKECEKHVIVGEGWSTPKRDFLAMQKMIEQGKRVFYKTESHYVRLRYAYQIIRLAHYGKGYNAVLKLHDELIPKVHANPSLMDYWIMGHKAGALLKLGKRVDAAYLYSLVFANCPSKRQSAFQSFSIKTNQEWNELILMCKSDNERAVLYTIRANADQSRAVEEMEKIYEFDPGNENLDLLMVKEIVKIEKDLLGLDFNDNRKRNKRYFNLPRKEAGEYLTRLQFFVDKCVNEKKVRELDLWKIAQGYLAFLGGNYYDADLIFSETKKSLQTKNKHLIEQLEVAQLALKIAQLEDDIDEEDENEIGNLIRDNELYWKYADFPDYINDKLNYIYKKTKQNGKAYRVHHTLAALKMNPDLEIIEDLLAICDKKDKSSLEAVLVKKDNLTTIKTDLLTLKGIVLFNSDKIEAALETFRKVPRNEQTGEVKFNPFHENIIDCLECVDTDTLQYNRIGVLEELLRLEYDGRAHLERGAASFYKLGNAYYNMTYFGHSWQVLDQFRSGANWNYVNDQNKYFTIESELGNIENMSMVKAKKYYETALELAKSKDLEARACFMLAKCNLNEFYIDPQTDYHPYSNKIPVLPEKYNYYHRKFMADYSDTQFYLEAIEECQFLKAY